MLGGKGADPCGALVKLHSGSKSEVPVQVLAHLAIFTFL